MGKAKEAMLHREDLLAVAQGVLEKAGAGESCPVHDGFLITNYDDEAEKRSYAIGTNMVRDGEVYAERGEFMDIIKQAIDDMAMECPSCTANAERD